MSRTQIQSLFEGAEQQERAGAWQAARRAYADACRLATEIRDTELLTESIIRTGHCCRRAGQREEAAEALEVALAIGECRGDDVVAARALNGLGLLCQGAGDMSGADAFFLRAHALAERTGDIQRLGEIHHNRGILAHIRGEREEALAWYGAALAHLRRTGLQHEVVAVLNSVGVLHVAQGRLEAAEDAFLEALDLSDRIHHVVLTGQIHISRAELFVVRGEYERARESCDHGFEIFSRLDDARGRAEALKFYGIIYRETGKYHLAAVHLREALDVAAGRHPLLEAEAQRELGLVLRLQGRNRHAMEALNRAHALFRALQADLDRAEVSERIAQIEADFLVLVQGWGESIEAKDRYTSGHCRRVADYACRMAEETGFPAHELVWFRMGAFLHDLGKTEVPAEILNKPGRLTDEERAVMERHTVIGDEMLSSVEFPWDVRPMVRSHHERWEGGGYPDGLRGQSIPVAARILRIADIFDALTTTRSYRRPLSPEEALAIMEEDTGSFDPELFAQFRRLFPELAEIARATQAAAAAEADVAGTA